jgi:hypothetical protein
MRYILCVALMLSVAIATADTGRLKLTDFEKGEPIYTSGEGVQPGSKVSVTTDQAHSGAHAVAIKYDFIAQPTGLQYVGVGFSGELVGKAQSLSAWVYGDGSGEWLRLRLADSTNQIFQWNIAEITWQGWKQVSVDLPPTDSHWSGSNDGKLHYPLHVDSLLIDSNVRPKQGVLYIDDVEYTTEAAPADYLVTEIADAPFGGVIWGGASPAAPKLRIRNMRTDAGFSGSVALQVSCAGQSTPIPRKALEIAPEQAALVPIDLPRGTEGLVSVEATISGGGADITRNLSLAVLNSPASLTLDRGSFFGACTHFGQDKGNNPETFRLMSRAGIKYLRDEIPWGQVEREKGKYAFDAYTDAWMQGAVANGVSPLIIFDYGNSLYDNGASPTSPEAQQAFGEYCYQLVTHYKGLCKTWEVYNEPNIGFWLPKPDPIAYARLLKIAYAAAKRADPTCTVLGVCTAGTDLGYIETVLKQGTAQSMDALSIHPYRYPGSPEKTSFVQEVTRAHDLMTKYGIGDKPIWLTEIGWPTQKDPAGVTEQASGNYLIRMYVQAMSLPFVRGVIWYDFQDDGSDVKYNECNFGLIHWQTYAPKGNYVAYKMLTQYTAGKKVSRRLLPTDVNDRRYCYEFSDAKSHVLVAWCDGGAASATIKTGMRSVNVRLADGRVKKMQTLGGNLSLPLDDMPVFIDLGAQRGELAQSMLDFAGVAEAAMPGEKLPVQVILHSPAGAPLRGRLSVTVPDGWSATWGTGEATGPEDVSLKPDGTDTRALTVAVPVDAKEGGYGLSAALQSVHDQPLVVGGATITVAQPVEITRTAPATNAPGTVVQEVVIRNLRSRPLTGVKATLDFASQTSIPQPIRLPPTTIPPHRWLSVPLSYGAASVPFGRPNYCTLTVSFPGGAEVRYPFTLGASALPRAAEPPVMDCDVAKWQNVPVAHLGSDPKDFFILREASTLKQKSADIRLQYDDKALYLLAVVNDDKHVQPYHGEDVWQGDNIQLAVDARHSAWQALDDGKTPTYAEIGLSRTTTGDEAYRWLWRPGLCKGIAFVSKREGNTTIYEAAMPWSEIGPEQPKRGDLIGFSLLVNANDGDGRDGWLEMFSGIGFGKDPRKFGTLVLG